MEDTSIYVSAAMVAAVKWSFDTHEVRNDDDYERALRSRIPARETIAAVSDRLPANMPRHNDDSTTGKR
jgi:hypothetical protein